MYWIRKVVNVVVFVLTHSYVFFISFYVDMVNNGQRKEQTINGYGWPSFQVGEPSCVLVSGVLDTLTSQ